MCLDLGSQVDRDNFLAPRDIQAVQGIAQKVDVPLLLAALRFATFRLDEDEERFVGSAKGNIRFRIVG